MLSLILVFLFISVFLMLFQVFKYLLIKKNYVLRLKKYVNMEEIKEERKKNIKKDYKAGFNIISRRVGNAKFLEGYKKRVQIQLTRAHLLLKAEEFITVCMALFAGLGILIFIPSHSLLYAICAALIGWLIPVYFLKTRTKRRMKHINEQLCDAIILISNSLKAGYSFFQAIDIVAKEMTGPIADEFALLQKEINLGITTEKALENLVGRVSSEDLEMVVTAVLIQRQVGGKLSEVLDNISSTIRERIKIKGEVKTLTAQGRMSGIVIGLLPVALGVILYMINPEHVSVLFTDPIGNMILVFSIIMELIGIYFINKIVRIKV